MADGFTRRTFLGGTAAGVAALGVPLIVKGAAAAPSKRVTVGVMGMGRGSSLAKTFGRTPGVVVKYVCDVDAKRAEAGKATVEKDTEQTPQAITDFRKILDDPAVDALVCAAPNHWHAPATILACAAGKNVYVEKPCSQNPWEGEAMVAAARAHHRVVQMGTQRRSGKGYIEAIEKLRGGVLGRVYLSRSWYNNLRGSIGVGKPASVPANLDYELWQGPAPRVPYYDNRIHYNWHWFWHWGNGELGNNGVHALDICRWGLGVDYPIKVASTGGRYAFLDDDQQTPDTHVATFEFPDAKQISWQGLSCNKHRDGSGFVSFYGEKGTLEIDGRGKYVIYDLNDKKIEEGGDSMRDDDHIANFVEAIRSQDPRSLNQEIEEGHKSTLMCHLGNIACRIGHTFTCSAENGRILGDELAMNLWKREYEPGWEPKW